MTYDDTHFIPFCHQSIGDDGIAQVAAVTRFGVIDGVSHMQIKLVWEGVCNAPLR